MDNERYCPMKLTSNPLGRCVCEKEKCAWWRKLENCCSVWWIASRTTVLRRVCGKRKGENMSKDNMGRNAEHYADPTPTAAMRNICRDEYQKEAARLDRIGDIVPLLRQMAGIAGFEIIGRIPLRDKATGKEYR